MAAILAGNNVEEEYLWSCTLTGSAKEYNWDPSTLTQDSEEKEGPKVKPSHRLLIKTAVLMPSAKKDEVTVVQIESEGYNKQTVSTVLVLELQSSNVSFLGHCSYLCHEGGPGLAEVH